MKKINPAKDLYQRLRLLTCEQLWESEVAAFDRGSPRERMNRVGVVRAVGVVFSESGTPEQKARAVDWLQKLLADPEEKIRRYAMNALPKLGGGRGEDALLNLLQSPASEREQRASSRTLEKIGGRATLAVASDPLLRQKVQANVARKETPGALRMDRSLRPMDGLHVIFHCREGLEEFVLEDLRGARNFRVLERRKGWIRAEPIAAFSLAEIYAWRSFAKVGFVIAGPTLKRPADFANALVRFRPVLEAFTNGPIRYRMEKMGVGDARQALREIAALAHAECPAILNDSRAALWQVDWREMPQGGTLEVVPRLRPDPRFTYRQGDVPAASHPPLAACMARLAGAFPDDTVWDPFCGSGLELIERGLLGRVRKMFGTDTNPEALEITRRNFEAAGLSDIPLALVGCDFREALTLKSFEPVSLILTNPPMGRRVPIADLQGLIEDLFRVAESALKPGGRLVLVNPLAIRPKALRLDFRRKIDLGGFTAHLEKYSG